MQSVEEKLFMNFISPTLQEIKRMVRLRDIETIDQQIAVKRKQRNSLERSPSNKLMENKKEAEFFVRDPSRNKLSKEAYRLSFKKGERSRDKEKSYSKYEEEASVRGLKTHSSQGNQDYQVDLNKPKKTPKANLCKQKSMFCNVFNPFFQFKNDTNQASNFKMSLKQICLDKKPTMKESYKSIGSQW